MSHAGVEVERSTKNATIRIDSIGLELVYMDSDAEVSPGVPKTTSHTVIDLSRFHQTSTIDPVSGNSLWQAAEADDVGSDPHFAPIVVEGHEEISDSELNDNQQWLVDQLRGLRDSEQSVLTRIFLPRFSTCRDRQLLQDLMVGVTADIKTILHERNSPPEFMNIAKERANAELEEKLRTLVQKMLTEWH